MSDAKRLVVIGSNSFSGASFVSHCLREGWEVLGTSRSPEAHEVFLPYRWQRTPEELSRFCFAQLDLNLHTAELVDAIADFKAPRVVNFAAQSMVAESWEHPDHWYQTNVVANVRLHDGLRKMPDLKKYVHVSTPEVYGSCSGDVREDAPFRPSTPYAASRAACDLHLQTFIRQYDFPAVFTRAANVFGPGQQLYRIVPRTLLFLALGQKLQLHGGGHSVRSFIHIDDVSVGTLSAALDGEPGQVFHLSTKRTIAIRDLVSLMCDQAGVKFEDFAEIVADRPGKDSAYLLDASLARTKLGWQDRVSLEEGIADTKRWIDANLDTLREQPKNYIHKA
ncbi:MAG: GDP-mannose 4,6-dehydratase [Verrucomicrobia bacterium]|jgi:dTDP-glucose 4,6-dehydratase|nr:GDP-mannose 4,6-dehydratase [Verrucomicrobiota bacterium]